MSDHSDFTENLILTWLYTDNPVTRPTARYLALYTSAPSDAGGGTEVSGNGYARQEVEFTVAGSQAVNDADLTFTATGSWGTIVAVGLFDAITAGNLLDWKVLSPTIAIVTNGQSFIVRAGELMMREA